MLKAKQNKDQKISVEVVNMDAPSDTDFYYNNLLTKAGISAVNTPFDSELYEYHPSSDTVNYFIYFLSFKDKDFNQDVINNIEPAFSDYYQTAKTKLGTTKNMANQFDFLQNNDNFNIPAHNEAFKTATQTMLDKPYQITDYVREVNKLTPIKSGLPLFYDTFTFPFSEQITMWKDRSNKFSDLPALYNSFLLLEFYTAPSATTQQKIMGLPIFVVDRYMMYEKSVNQVKQLRPTFLLKNGIEGYSIFFLQNFGISRLYVKYSFWDAMNGGKIPLIPSSIHTTYKKGIQSVSNFDHRNEYIMVDLNFNTHTYKMYEFNNISKEYDIQAYDFDLYELFYDDFWAGKVVKNTRPVALQEPSTFVINFNQTIDLTINHTKISNTDTLYMTDISQSTVDNYYSGKYNDGGGYYIKEYLKTVFPTLKTTKSILPVDKKLLFVDQDGKESNSNCFQKTIDTITITNNNNDNVAIYDVFIGDIKLYHTPMYHSDNIGSIENKNNVLVDNIYRKKITKSSKEQNLFVENYVTYSDLGIINQKHDLIGEMYKSYSSKFTSPYNQNEANRYRVIENLDFDITNPKSLATYLRNNYIFSKRGQQNYSYSTTGRGTASGNELYTDTFGGYYQILHDYIGGDLNINRLIFRNLITDDRNKFMDNLLYINKSTYGIKLSKDVAYESNPSYWFTESQIGQDILPNLKDNNTAIKSIDSVFESKDTGHRKIWLRDCMAGFNITYKTDNATLSLNEKIDFNVNFLMGEQFAIHALNPNNSLTLSATIKIILADRFSNRKTYTIPVSYKLNIV